MKSGRFVLSVICGAMLAFWSLFLASLFLGDGEGQIHWTGSFQGEFLPWYFTALYVPPLLAVTTAYLALRRITVTNAQN